MLDIEQQNKLSVNDDNYFLLSTFLILLAHSTCNIVLSLFIS